MPAKRAPVVSQRFRTMKRRSGSWSSSWRRVLRPQARGCGYKSSGRSPVCRATRASMTGPISSPSWKAHVKLGQPGRTRVRWEPVVRAICHPVRRRAARTRLALLAGQRLTLRRRRRTRPPARMGLRHAPACPPRHVGQGPERPPGPLLALHRRPSRRADRSHRRSTGRPSRDRAR